MPKPKRSKSKSSQSKHKRPRGRPATRIIEQVDAPPEEIVKAVFRVADQQRDERLKKGR